MDDARERESRGDPAHDEDERVESLKGGGPRPRLYLPINLRNAIARTPRERLSRIDGAFCPARTARRLRPEEGASEESGEKRETDRVLVPTALPRRPRKIPLVCTPLLARGLRVYRLFHSAADYRRGGQ